MKKIPSVFKRDEDRKFYVREFNPECEWVLDGKGKATKKFDGTSCMIKEGKLYKRYEIKDGKKVPIGFISAEEPDSVTGQQGGWVKCSRNNPSDQYHWLAFDTVKSLKDGTYELCGPKINNNRHHFNEHILIPHGGVVYVEELVKKFGHKHIRHYDYVLNFLKKVREESPDIEGIVYHHSDGRMAKVKCKCFREFN